MERNRKAYSKILAQYEDMTQDLFFDIRRGIVTSYDEFEAITNSSTPQSLS